MTLTQDLSSADKQLVLDDADRALIAVIQSGLPLCSRPYAEVAAQLGIGETAVIDRLKRLRDQGAIKRMGVVVRHHELGYRANAMVVWDVADDRVSELGRCMGRFPFVTLCYRRPRRLPDWRYNLFCMIHGRDRDAVLAHVDHLVDSCDLQAVAHEVLFSTHRFKQRGARYSAKTPAWPKPSLHLAGV